MIHSLPPHQLNRMHGCTFLCGVWLATTMYNTIIIIIYPLLFLPGATAGALFLRFWPGKLRACAELYLVLLSNSIVDLDLSIS